MADDRVRGSRILRVEGLANARDLGGLRRVDGTLTPRRVFYRSESVDRITPAGWDQVQDAGIRTIVDLRQPGERACDISRRPDWLTTLEVDLDGLENQSFWRDYWETGLVGTALYFSPHLQAMPERSGAALSAIVKAPPGGVMFHCMSGRDRTGMIAMLLLAAVNVEVDEIIDDYLETVRLGDLRAAIAKGVNDEPAREALCAAHGTTTEGAFRTSVASLDLERVLSRGHLSRGDRAALVTWRGNIS